MSSLCLRQLQASFTVRQFLQHTGQSHAGAFQLECLPDNILLQVGQDLTLAMALPAALVGGPLLILGILFAIYYKDIFRELEARRNNRLKIR